MLPVASVPSARAGLIDPPPAIVAMWDGKDGASVRAALLPIAALGEQPGASARQKLESGEAAWWLGLQNERRGLTDSAVTQWRRAVARRGDFDEGFALIDALCRRVASASRARARTSELDEAYRLAVSYAAQAPLGMPSRNAEAQARLAWVHRLRGHADTALATIRPWADALRRRPSWTRRLATIERDGADHDAAWKSLTLLSARTRGRDAEVESLLVLTQRALGMTDEQRRLAVQALRAPVEASERRFMAAAGGRRDSLVASEPVRFTVRWVFVPAAKPRAGTRPLAPVLFVLSPDDSLVAADSLATALAAAGHAVAFLAPRGAYDAVGVEAHGPETWDGRYAEFRGMVCDDATRVMDALTRRRAVPAGGWIVGAAGPCAPIAVQVARLRQDTRALLLVAPRLPLVEVAETRAQLRALGTRTFVQVSPEEPDALELADLLSRQTSPGQVRVADSGERGRGVAIYRSDPKIAKRLLDWLAEPAAKP